MKKEIRNVNEEKGILQITTVDERWYIRQSTDEATGLPTYDYVPSVTWIADHYPKGIAFYKWLASKGWDEAEALKQAAADKGSKVHLAIADLIDGKEVKINAKYINPTTEKEEELTLEEYEAISSFAEWFKKVKPKVVERDFVVWGEGYAGTVDLFCEIDGRAYVVDFKTSQYIWPSHELQVSAYLHALPPEKDTDESFPPHLAILQLGYRLNKNKYKFTEIEDNYQEFLAAKLIWAKEQKGVYPAQKDYPLKIKL
ncbi:MAG: hypothetical protein WC312_03965 [Candidatus Omnitrophota bacterium]|jgi:hypothetical protein